LLLRLPRTSPSHVDHDPGRIVPRISSFALQRFRNREPFFSLPLSWKRRRNVALVLRSLTLGFGYPPDEMVWLPDPWGSLSTPNAPGLRSSELSSFQVIEEPSRVPLSAPALPGETRMTSPRRSSGFIPPRKPCPLLHPKCLAWGGTVALLSFQTSQALPLPVLMSEASSLRHSPLDLTKSRSCDSEPR
jgi:hypothetical protein